MDLAFLFNLGNRLKAYRDSIRHAAPGDVIGLPAIKGLRIFGRRVGLTLTFDIEG